MEGSVKGWIKGFVDHDEISQWLMKKFSTQITVGIYKIPHMKIEDVWKEYKINPGSEDSENWYNLAGYLNFTVGEVDKALFYSYSNLCCFDDLAEYTKYGLNELATSETTSVSLKRTSENVALIREIVASFGGGWIDEWEDEEGHCYVVEAKE